MYVDALKLAITWNLNYAKYPALIAILVGLWSGWSQAYCQNIENIHVTSVYWWCEVSLTVTC